MNIELILSIVLYFSVLLLCLIAANRAKYTPRMSFWFIVIVLTLLAGLRHQSVGIDTVNYVDLLMPLKEGFSWQQNNINEPGFLFLSYVLLNISNGYTLMFTVFAFIINYFTIKRLFDLRSEISFPWAIFIFFMQYYFTSFNTVRQWIAMAILFYFSKYIGDKKGGTLKFIIAVAVATMFHKTALIMIALVPLFFLLRKSRTISHQIIKMTMIILAPIVMCGLLVYIQVNYSIYQNISSPQDISIVAIVRLLFLIFMLIMSSIDARYNTSDIGLNNDSNVELIRVKDKERLETAITVLGVICTLMVFFFKYADRLASYFMMFEMIVYPRYIKSSRLKLFVQIFVLVLFAFLRIMSFRANGYGESVYHFAWEQVESIIQ